MICQTATRIQVAGAPAEAILVHGASGVGKTHLIKTALDSAESSNLLVGFGKFDHDDNPQPYSAIVYAIAEICFKVSNQAPEEIQTIKDQIGRSFDKQDLSILVQTMPSITALSPWGREAHDTDSSHGAETPTDTVIIRFNNLMTLAGSGQSVVLVVDDCQWADPSSRKLLDSIALDSKLTNILLLGSVRDGESTTFAFPEKVTIRRETVVIEELAKEAVTQMVVKALRRDEHALKELIDLLHRRCGGNPFFLIQFMEQAHRDKLLWFSDVTNQFEFDLATILASTNASTNIVDILVSKIKRVPANTRITMILFAAIGHSVNAGVLESIAENKKLVALAKAAVTRKGSGKTSMNIAEALIQAEKANLIEPTSRKGDFKFVHDRIQQAARKMIPSGKEKSHMLSELGVHLLKLSESDKSFEYLIFAAVNLLLKHRGMMPKGSLARLCLKAAKKAYGQAAMETSASIADSGLKVLGRTRWKDFYDLACQLCSLSAEAHFSCGNLDDCDRRVEDIQKNVRRVEDSFRGFRVRLEALGSRCDYIQAKADVIRALGLLGIELPNKPGLFYILGLYRSVQKCLKGREPKEFFSSLPKCTDPKIQEAIALASEMTIFAFLLSEPGMVAAGCFLCMKLSIEHGSCPMTHFTLMCYVAILSAFGDVKGAYSFGEVGVELARESGLKACDTFQAFGTFAFSYKKPMKELPEWYGVSIAAAKKAGDSYKGSFVLHLKLVSEILCSKKTLWELTNTAQASWDYMKEFKQSSAMGHAAAAVQTVFCLQDRENDGLSLSGSFYDDTEYQAILREKNASVDPEKKLAMLYTQKMRMIFLYIMGKYDEANADLKKHARLDDEKVLSVFVLFHAFVCALNTLALARKKGKLSFGARRKLDRHIQKVKAFDGIGSPNVAVFILFIEAEQLSLAPGAQSERVVQKYNAAIQALKEGEFYLMEAKATERLGDYLMRFPEQKQQAVTNLELAWKKYVAYGALSPRTNLLSEYGDTLQLDQVQVSAGGSLVPVEAPLH